MKLFLSSLLLLIFSITMIAQEELPDRELLLFHEDVIYPYMQEKYENAAKNFNAMLKEANVKDDVRVLQQEYFTYTYITPVKDFDGLSTYMKSEEMDKIDEDKMKKVMSGFDGCYASHKDYLMSLRNDLSYKPKYGLDPSEGMNFRHIDYIWVIPGKEEEMTTILKEYKALYESKNIEEGYRIYFGRMGTDGPLAIIVQPAKGRTDWAMLSDRQDEELGKEGSDLLNRVMSITQKFEHKNGEMRTDLYYPSK
ncbi:MAG TPA: hypothetical protein VLN45_02325 [Ignavibacteriaceae bacterium]|nr:hypothetical protein [Ignavibacteriaceae bacterium]